MNANVALSDNAAPTLELVRFALRSADGAAWKAPLSVRTAARRVGLLGNWEPLFQVLSGRAEVASGTAQLLGCDLESALARGILGYSACDVPLPATFTVSEYLRHAARLSHGSTSRAQSDEKRALDRYGLAEIAKRRLAELPLYQRRALGIALSTLTAPPVVLLEAPLRGLDARSGDYIARLCSEAAAHSRLLLSGSLSSSLGPERSLLEACDELVLIEQGELVAQGAPSTVFSPGARYALCVKGDEIEGFVSTLRAAGVRLEARTQAGCFNAELPGAGGESTDLLLDSALAHGLIVLQLEPLFVG